MTDIINLDDHRPRLTGVWENKDGKNGGQSPVTGYAFQFQFFEGGDTQTAYTLHFKTPEGIQIPEGAFEFSEVTLQIHEAASAAIADAQNKSHRFTNQIAIASIATIAAIGVAASGYSVWRAIQPIEQTCRVPATTQLNALYPGRPIQVTVNNHGDCVFQPANN